jgi:hypothetical protein
MAVVSRGFEVSRNKDGTHTITATGDTGVSANGNLVLEYDVTLSEDDVRNAIRAFQRYVHRQGSKTTTPDDWPTSGTEIE